MKHQRNKNEPKQQSTWQIKFQMQTNNKQKTEKITKSAEWKPKKFKTRANQISKLNSKKTDEGKY